MARPLDVLPRPLVLAGRPVPVVGTARVYVCGITPYDVTHLGHAATFVWADTAVRVLKHLGTDVEVCRNVTDVDDVLSAAARGAGRPYDELAVVSQFQFTMDMDALRVGRPTFEPRAHTHVGGVVAVAAALLAGGAAYEKDGTVYLRGTTVPGSDGPDALVRLAAFGEDPDDPAKEDPRDVPVWRASRGHEPAWPSPWGPGRPGWHAECTAMALTLLGASVDLHAGGEDLRYPHHAYEAAAAEAVTGVRPFARAWLHVGAVCVDGDKMAKSAGNLVRVQEVLRDHRPAAVRMLLLDRPWSQPWDYATALLEAAETRLDALHAAAGRSASSATAVDEVTERLRVDLDVPAALAISLESGGEAARTLVRVLALD